MSSQIRKRVNKKITKAIHDFNLIEDGDRVLIATSGGKDSSVLLMELAARLGKFGPKCELAAIHIQSDFADKAPREFLQRMADEYPQVPFYFKDVAVEARLKEGRKLNCYWCSTQRRTELIKFASENNFNKIALGHHIALSARSATAKKAKSSPTPKMRTFASSPAPANSRKQATARPSAKKSRA